MKTDKQLLLLWGKKLNMLYSMAFLAFCYGPHSVACVSSKASHFLRWPTICGECFSLNKSTSYYQKKKKRRKSREITSERDDLQDQYCHQTQGLPIILFCIFPVGFTPRLTPQVCGPPAIMFRHMSER